MLRAAASVAAVAAATAATPFDGRTRAFVATGTPCAHLVTAIWQTKAPAIRRNAMAFDARVSTAAVTCARAFSKLEHGYRRGRFRAFTHAAALGIAGLYGWGQAMVELDASLRNGKRATFDRAVSDFSGATVLWARSVTLVNRARRRAHLPTVP